MLQSYYSTLTTHTHTQLVYNGANGYIKNNKRTTKKKDDEKKLRRKKKRDDDSTVPGYQVRYGTRYLVPGTCTCIIPRYLVIPGGEKSWWVSVNNVYFIHEIPTTFHRRKKKYNYKLKS